MTLLSDILKRVVSKQGWTDISRTLITNRLRLMFVTKVENVKKAKIYGWSEKMLCSNTFKTKTEI